VSSLASAKGHKEDTILDWIRDAAQHAEAIEEVLMADYQLSRGQLDTLCLMKGEKGLSGNGGKQPHLSCHDDRHRHPAASSPWDGQDGGRGGH